MTDAFISYSRRDKEFVNKLYEAFKQLNHDVWVDWESIPLTSDWRQEIYEGIIATNNFIFVISPDSVNSSECAVEVEQAIKHNKRLVPIVYRNVDPKDTHPNLAAINWIFFRESDDFDRAFQQLIKALDTDLNHVKIHTRLQQRAIEWDKKERDRSFLLYGSDLKQADQWVATSTDKEPQPTALQTQYIVASGHYKSKRQGAIIGGVALGFVLTTGLAITSLSLYYIAVQRRHKAEKLHALAHVATAKARYYSDNQLGSLVEALEASTLLQQLSWISENHNIKQETLQTLREIYDGMAEENRLEGHEDLITNIRSSPDGQVIASSSADNTVRLWQRNGKLLKILQGHTSVIGTVMFSADGKLIASASDDKTVKIWTLQGELIRTIQDTSPVWSVSFSPDNQLLVTSGSDSTLKLWRSDGQTIASGSTDHSVRLWSRDGKLLKTLKGHQDIVLSVSVSPDGQLIASGSTDSTIKLWSRDGRLLNTLEGHQDGVRGISFSPDGQLVASASLDKTIKLWRIDGTLLQTLKGHSAGVYGVAFSGDGQTLVSGSTDNTVKLWSLSGQLLTSFVAHDAGVTAVGFSPNGQTVVSGSFDNKVRLWSRDGTLLQTFRGHTERVLGVSFSPNGQTIASASADKTVKLWDVTGINPIPLSAEMLFAKSCDWIRNYLQTNPRLDSSTRALCQPSLDIYQDHTY
jgi:WD40 repeat protein